MPNEIPQALLKKNPLLPLIMKAIDQHKAGKKVTQKDPATGKALIVEEDAELGILLVRSGDKVLYRSRHKTSG